MTDYEKWQPTKAFYEQDEQSAQLRLVCQDILNVIYEIITIKDICNSDVAASTINAYTQNDLPNLYSKLEMAEGSLISLGIQPVETFDDAKIKRDDPVATVQFLAGHLRTYLGHLTEELDDEQLENVYFFFDEYLDLDPADYA